MAFSRELAPEQVPGHHALTSAMAGIGMGFAASTAPEPNIEDTLFFASTEATERSDLRVIAILVSWFGVHHEWVNADRLTKLVSTRGSERAWALWTAIARWQGSDRRYSRLAARYRGPRLDLLAAGSELQIRRHGEDPRFEGSCLRVPANLLRDRPADVVPPDQLATQHRTYRYRIMMGTSFRADCWAMLESEPGLSAADRRTTASTPVTSSEQSVTRQPHASDAPSPGAESCSANTGATQDLTRQRSSVVERLRAAEAHSLEKLARSLDAGTGSAQTFAICGRVGLDDGRRLLREREPADRAAGCLRYLHV